MGNDDVQKDAVREHLLSVILPRLEEKGLSARKLSLLAVGHDGLIKSIKAGSVPSADSLKAIANVLGLEFYFGLPRSAGFSEAAETFQGQAQERGWVFLHPKQAEILDGPAPIERMRYADRWFEERGMSPDMTALVYVDETGMEPTIRQGTTVVIDTSDTGIGKNSTLQATSFGRLVRIRRVEHHDGQTISRPDNPRHLVDTYSKAHGDLFTVLGRVRAVVSEFK